MSSDYYYYESEWLRLLGMASDFDFYNYEYGTDIYDTMWYWYRYYSDLASNVRQGLVTIEIVTIALCSVGGLLVLVAILLRVLSGKAKKKAQIIAGWSCCTNHTLWVNYFYPQDSICRIYCKNNI
jgi:hypothetical protein